LQDNADHRSV